MNKKYYFLLLLIISFLFVFLPSQYLQNSLLAKDYIPSISFFRKSPRLSRSNAVYRQPDVISTYIFEITIPENADNNLQKVIINQQVNFETITFYPEDSKAYIIGNQETLINANFTVNNQGKNEIIIDLLDTVKPGETLRLAITARNPAYGGIYQFGVTVYPQGDNSQSLYLGNARFSFDTRGDRF